MLKAWHRERHFFVAMVYALSGNTCCLMNVWLLTSSVSMSICAETGWTPTNVRKHQRDLVTYTLRGHMLHLAHFCIEFWFCWTEGIRTEIEGRNVHLSLLKGVVLIHLVYIFHEAENVKISFSTQMYAGEVCSALAVGCCCKTDVTESDLVAPFLNSAQSSTVTN